MIRVLEAAVYRGPHYYSTRPMIRIMVDLGPLEDFPSDRLPNFADELLARLPGLERHGCSYRQPGGFVRRLREGTWLGHIAEHIALELQTLAGAPASRGKTRSVKGRPGVYNILFSYRSEAAGRLAGRCALDLANSLLPPDLQGLEGLDLISPPPKALEQPFDLNMAVAEIAALIRKEAFGPTTQSLVDAARRRRIPVTRLNEYSLVQLGWGARRKILRASITGETSLIAVETAGDKSLTKALLGRVGVAVPKGQVVRTADEAVAAAQRIKGPVVVKPLDGNHGRGVNLDLRSEDQVRWGFEQAVPHSRRVIVEQHYTGRDYRILVVGGQVVAVAERRPAEVVGDGRHSIAELIAQVNADPRRGVGHEAVMTRIVIDAHVEEMLARVGMTAETVPPRGKAVQLRATANLSTGGTAVDRTDIIHPDNAAMARRAALTVGLDVAGIDFIAPDITRSVRETGGGIVEVNAAPGFRMHLAPSEGKPRDVAQAVIDLLYPAGSRARIPIVAVTGTNGKSTVGRMIAAILRRQGLTVGLTNTSGVYVNDERLVAGDASGPRSARMVLADPTVEAAVLETARGGILREGLAFDRCDVGIVLNIAADHLGLKGINTLEDLARVKSVVTESVSRRGLSVLNGDDPHTLRMARHAGGRVAYFTMAGGEAMSPLLQKHLLAGGITASVEDGMIVIQEGPRRTEVMGVDDIPATLNGAAAFNVQNALAAVLAGHGLKVPVATVREALAAFGSSYEQNPGRLNIHEVGGVRVILDYAHNGEAVRALGALLDRMRPSHGRVIGVASMPGDRRDEDIREMGALAGQILDRVVFRERPDGRGRPTGAVLALLTEGAIQAGADPAHIEQHLSEHDAVDAALRAARPGDLVVIMPTEVEAVWRQILAYEPDFRAPPSNPELLHV
ncbi:cyanophycin synthetase [Caulobacter sp. SLTY]|uniref:cyanophycin synthetase n=1 Tax=Caulobacter sp. SLTY TaxID=2683262 RepID=UPI0014137346|nr:cyanophycin synthetase [Caulobacter sp. SLTY]NBB15686.1 cyanophycin synthetase [Caulobacter sp. SLTY]